VFMHNNLRSMYITCYTNIAASPSWSWSYRVKVMVFNATFNNISVISWRLVLLVEETGVPLENHQPAAIHWKTLYQYCCIPVVVVIILSLDLQLPNQSVPTTTNIMVRITLRWGVLDTLCDKVVQWIAAGWWFSILHCFDSFNTFFFWYHTFTRFIFIFI
jgi:hypothetical protein